MALYPRIPIISIMRNDLYNQESTFFDAFYYPEPATREQFLNYFLLEYGEFTPVYQYPDFLLNHIKAVSASLKYTIDKLYATLTLEYNPIENYDRQESWTDSGSTSRSRAGTDTEATIFSGGETTTYAGGQSNTKSGGHSEARLQHEIERQVSADNTGSYFPSEKTIEDPDTVTTTFNDETDTQSFNNRSDTKQFNNRSDSKNGTRSENEIGTDQTVHAGRIHGNVGVTTSQEMIRSEREDVAYYNFIDDVARLYGEKLCIMIY